MISHATTMGQGGRVVIPAEYRRALRLEPGTELIIWLEDAALRIAPRDLAIREAQDIVSRYVTGGGSLVDELLEERRRESISEASDVG